MTAWKSQRDAEILRFVRNQLAERVRRQGQLICLAWAGMVVLQQVPLGGSWRAVPWETWLLLGTWIALFFIAFSWSATVSARSAISAPVETEGDENYVNNAIRLLALVSATGASVVVFDFAVLRGYGFSTTAATIRMEEVLASIKGMSSSSPLSGAGRLLIPAMLPALIITVLRWPVVRRSTLGFLAVCSVVLLFEQVRFEGGRFFLTAIGVSTLIAALLRPAGFANPFVKSGLSFKTLLGLGVLGIVFLSFFAYVFVERIMDRDGFFWSAYIGYASNFEIDFDYGRIGLFDGVLGPMWFSACMLWMYATQGVSEFDQILAVLNFQHANGGYQFIQLTQASDALLGTDTFYDRFANLPHMGTYVTLPGAFFIDFGVSGMLASAVLLGWFAALCTTRLIRGAQGPRAAMAPIVLTLCYFSPVVSLVPNLWPALVWCLALPILRSMFGQRREAPMGSFARRPV